MTSFQITLLSQNQTFTVTLAGKPYQLSIYWNKAQQVWYLDIADNSGNPIATGLPIITGLDILGQLQYLGIGGSLVLQTEGDTLAPPTFDNLGQTAILYFVPNDQP
jgi:hypothetical protein